MNRIKWQRMFIAATLLFTTLFPVGAALAASPAHSTDFLPSCLQSLRENLGTVSPGSSVESQSNQCDRAVSADAAFIPVTGGVSRSAPWSDAGVSLHLSGSSGWRDAGAGSR
jgi:hypothetical protein